MPDRSKVMTQMESGILALQVGSLVRLTISPHKKAYVEKTSRMPQMGPTHKRRPGYTEKDLIFGIWNVPIQNWIRCK
jgi:hypothetical protein